MTSLRRTAAPLLLALCGACSYQLISPPAHIVHAESAAPVKPGETMVGARGGFYAAVFDPSAVVATGGVRRGIIDGVEASAEGTYAYVVADESPSTNRDLFIGRVAAKAGNRYAAATGGVGGGLSPAAGSFGAFDAGAILSYPNCYVVPFLAPSAFVSIPIESRTVVFDKGQTSKADTSYGYGGGAGIEIPLDHARCREGRTPARLQLGMNMFNILSSPVTPQDGGITETRSRDYFIVGWVAGFEVPL